MKNKKKVWIIVVFILLLAIFFIAMYEPSQITYVIIREDEEVKQEDFIPDEEKGLVGYFVVPETLVENENIKIRITKIIPQEDFHAKLEVVVENNLEEEVLVYSEIQVDKGEENQEKAVVHSKPIYKKTIIEEAYKDGEKIDEKEIPNSETYDEFYFRKREDFTDSMNYKYKQVFDIEICYAEKCMNPEEMDLYLQIFYSTKSEKIISTENIIELLTNEEIEERKVDSKTFATVTSFNDVNQDVIEIGNKQYVLERNMILLKSKEIETETEEEIIYQPQKRGHYILKYYVGESCIYFLEEVPGEEIVNPDIYKKYCRLCVINRDGTEAAVVLDDLECDWFYIPAVYVYNNILYVYDWDFLYEYKLDKYGKPEEVIIEENSIYSNVFSESLLIYDFESEKNDFYGLPFWLNKYGYRVVSSDSGEVMMDKNGEWENLFYTDETTGEQIGFYGTDLEAFSKSHLVFRVSQTDDFEEAYIYNLDEEKVEGVLTLPNGDTNCQAISTDEDGIYFVKRLQTATSKQQIYYYKFATKSVEKSKK